MRPFVTFNYDLRKGIAGQSIAKIKRYHKELSAITRPPHFIFRPRRKDHLKLAAKKAGIEPRFSQIKAVPIATTEDKPLRWIDKKGRFVLQEKYIMTVFVPADPMAILKDPKAYARKIIKENPDAKSFHIKVGNNFLPMVFSKTTFTAGFARFLRRYKGEKKIQFVNNVLSGFDLTGLKEQSTYMQWRAEQKRKRKKTGRKRKGYGSHR